MFAKGFTMLLRNNGQDAEIRRQGTTIAKSKALVHEKEGYFGFPLGTDIRAGDEVFFVLSEKLYQIERVEKKVAGSELVSLSAHFSAPPRHGQPSMVVYGSVVTAQTITGSALQFHSPGATQTLTATGGQKEKAEAAIRLVLDVLNELDLSDEDKAEVQADAEAVQVQVKSPKTKWQHVKDFFAGIREKVKTGMTEKAAAAVIAKGEAAVQAINDFHASVGGA